MYILIHGADSYQCTQKINEMVGGFKQKRDPQGLNVAFFDCAKEGPDKMWGQISTVPFLAEKRMVVIHGVIENYESDVRNSLLEKLRSGSFAETSVLVFVEKKDKFGNNKLAAFLQKQPYSKHFPVMDEAARERWIKKYVADLGVSITTGAARIVAAGIEDTWQLASVCQQALAFASGEEIKREHVSPFVSSPLDDNIFNFTDALAAGNTAQALKLLDDQKKSGANEFYLLTMITRQFRLLLQLNDNPNQEELEDLKLHPFVVKKTSPLARRYTPEQLQSIHKNLYTIEKTLKTSSSSADILLDQFVMSAK